MAWHLGIASALRRIGVAAIAVVSLVAGVGRVQSQYDVFASGALAIAAYEASKERCVYSGQLGKALADIDAFLNRQDAYRWEESKRVAPDGMTGARNMARMQGASDCKVYGLLIGNAAIVYFNVAEFDQAVFAEFNGLQKGEGRSISVEVEGRSPQPPAPGNAADTIARLNRQNPTMNQSADTGGRASTLRRLPADDGVPPVSPSQPPPRQSAEPPPRRERAPSAPLAQVAPFAAPPSRGSPNPAPQPSPPTASPSSDCRVAGDCRLAHPTFACNLNDAARLAGLGPDAGRQAGLAAVRAGTCEIVAAGRSLRIEATNNPHVVYVTEQGRHVGYLPLGVFAPADQAAAVACLAPGFCAVRTGGPAWICPQPNGLDQLTPEAKRAAGCLQVSSNVTAEVAPAEGNTIALLNMVGGSPPVPKRYYVTRDDLIGLDLTPPPTPAGRGWCRPGDWCVISVAALFCWDRAAYDRIMGLASADARRTAISGEPDCRLLLPGSLLKPSGLPATNEPRKLIEVEHPVLKAGWASANAFKVVAYNPPVRYTAQIADLTVSFGRGPALVAIALRAQGTSEASGIFRAGPAERLAFCHSYHGDERPSEFRACFGEPDITLNARADCTRRSITLSGGRSGRFELREYPGAIPAEAHTDPRRHWLFRDLASGEWLDGTTASGEVAVTTAFDALCPSANPEAIASVAYRDARAQFPRELQGRWYDDRRACADRRRNEPDYDEHGWMEITAESRVGSRQFEWPQRINAVRTLGQGGLEIDGSHRIDDATVPEIFQSNTYRLTRDGFELRQQGHMSEWVRCR